MRVRRLIPLIAQPDYKVINERRSLAEELIQVAFSSIDARTATTRALKEASEVVDLNGCVVFAFGKAALPMAQATLEQIEVARGRVHCFESGCLGPLTLVESNHPSPAPDAAERGEELLELARSLGPKDVALCLVSGGGSSMLERPRPGVSLAQLAEESARLMRAGADIQTLNQRRRELSMVKGGGLSEAIRPAQIVNIMISDTPGAPLETVASGPTFPADHTFIAADHLTMRDAVLRAAPQLRPMDELISGEARELGARLASMEPGFIATGETTVTVTGQGRGGRNHELVLGALQTWRAQSSGGGLLLSIGSDGVDGSSDAAGAWCDEALLRCAPDPAEALRNNDAHAYFKRIGGQLVTGPTGTNVADLVISLP